MTDLEGDKRSEKHEVVAEQRCRVRMHNQQPCGRPIYSAPASADEKPVCMMHSKDPNKSDAAFQDEFERILGVAGKGAADFTRFVFPSARYADREFSAECTFRFATFTQDADFNGAAFTRNALFYEAMFTKNAVFNLATFAEGSSFAGARFAEDADFFHAEFTRDATFSRARFTRGANFCEATFIEDAFFKETTFTGSALFTKATFTQDAIFVGATFTEDADFIGATFTRYADFQEAIFTRLAEFRETTFTEEANFSGVEFQGHSLFGAAKFIGNVYFNWLRSFRPLRPVESTSEDSKPIRVPHVQTLFAKKADFRNATFRERAEFRQTRFREDGAAEPGPILSDARFEKPDLVLFYKTHLGQALFHNCDVSRFVFSSVRWRQRSNGKRMVLEDDEELDLSQEVTRALLPQEDEAGDRNYALIAELYQQLKKNYDDKRDYWTAGDFHYGEMEMKRLSSHRRNPILRWLHRHLGLVAWYKYASDYGESYVKPFLRLLLVLALFTFIYPACGLHRVSSEKGSPSRPAAQTSSPSTNADEISYAKFSEFLTAHPNGKLRGTVSFFVQSAMTSVSVASLRRDFADYEPRSVSGRFAALIEFLLTSTLVALFLLAVRRQFRR
jgi:hypothetical protein